jgi:hypothetical protein
VRNTFAESQEIRNQARQQYCQSGALFSVAISVRARARVLVQCTLARSLVVVVASALLDKSSLGRHRRKRQHPVAGGD